MYIHFVYSSIDRHLRCFQLLAIVNNASVNNPFESQLSILWECTSIYTWNCKSYDNSMFNSLRKPILFSTAAISLQHTCYVKMKSNTIFLSTWMDISLNIANKSKLTNSILDNLILKYTWKKNSWEITKIFEKKNEGELS